MMLILFGVSFELCLSLYPLHRLLKVMLMLLSLPKGSWFLIITLVYTVDIFVRWFGLGFRSFRANGWNIFDVVVASGALTTTVIDRSGSDSFVIQQLQKLFLVSIAFKLIQRTNSLNQLFKTAMCVHIECTIFIIITVLMSFGIIGRVYRPSSAFWLSGSSSSCFSLSSSWKCSA
jgi:hypothetical protein